MMPLDVEFSVERENRVAQRERQLGGQHSFGSVAQAAAEKEHAAGPDVDHTQHAPTVRTPNPATGGAVESSSPTPLSNPSALACAGPQLTHPREPGAVPRKMFSVMDRWGMSDSSW